MCYGKAPSSALFFFSSRRRHTIFDCDWSSDVCSSDLVHRGAPRRRGAAPRERIRSPACGSANSVTIEPAAALSPAAGQVRSEEHTSELQSQSNLVCRLLLEKKKKLQNQVTRRSDERLS